jgi:hypoxanthine phosphoribosyltransferase
VQGDVDKVLIPRERIAARVAELSAAIVADSRKLSAGGAGGTGGTGGTEGGDEAEIVLVPVLTGSIIFVADLMRQLPLKLRIDLVTASSYPRRATASLGAQIVGSIRGDLAGRHVLIVDDILDSGQTITLIRQEVARREPRSVKSCVLLRKQRPAAMAVPCEYVGFDIPDAFVVGYGLDYDNYYRNLPDIATLKEDIIRG